MTPRTESATVHRVLWAPDAKRVAKIPSGERTAKQTVLAKMEQDATRLVDIALVSQVGRELTAASLVNPGSMATNVGTSAVARMELTATMLRERVHVRRVTRAQCVKRHVKWAHLARTAWESVTAKMEAPAPPSTVTASALKGGQVLTARSPVQMTSTENTAASGVAVTTEPTATVSTGDARAASDIWGNIAKKNAPTVPMVSTVARNVFAAITQAAMLLPVSASVPLDSLDPIAKSERALPVDGERFAAMIVNVKMSNCATLIPANALGSQFVVLNYTVQIVIPSASAILFLVNPGLRRASASPVGTEGDVPVHHSPGNMAQNACWNAGVRAMVFATP